MATIVRPRRVVSELSSPEHVRLTGVAFASLGLAAMLLPAVTHLPEDRVLTLLLIFWGAGGVIVAFTARKNVDRSAFLAIAVFGLSAGLYYAISGTAQVGLAARILAVVFGGQGILALLLGMRLRRKVPAWGWLVWCGGFSIAMAVVLLSIWPAGSSVTFAGIVSANFLSTALALYRLSRR